LRGENNNRLGLVELFEAEAGILQDTQEQTLPLRKIAAMHGHDEHAPLWVFQDDVGPGLANLAIPAPLEKMQEISDSGH
jgi:hypothetical protein